jgi:hypothetical protein|tara:strand:+ start:551 stop:694 length:144 start_codon:yes stop_codon:yes gene_type:complete
MSDDYMEFITWYLTKRMNCTFSAKEDEEVVTEWYVNHLKDQELFVEN